MTGQGGCGGPRFFCSFWCSVQLFMGGIVAGLRAGLVENTWPLIDGTFIPPADVLWPKDPWWINIFDTPVTAQFLHRMIAYVIFIARGPSPRGRADERRRQGAHAAPSSSSSMSSRRSRSASRRCCSSRRPSSGTPHILLALAHQAIGMAVLAVATLQARRLVNDLDD